MNKRFYYTVLISLTIGAQANAQNFSSAKVSYSGSAEISQRAILQTSSSYHVAQDLIVNNALILEGSGNVRVHGNLVANAPVQVDGSGSVIVDGDIIARNALTVDGSGSIVAKGKIYVIRDKGSLNKSGTGHVSGEIVYSEDFTPSPTRRTVSRVTHSRPSKRIVVDKETDTVVETTGGTKTVSVTPGGVTVYKNDGVSTSHVVVDEADGTVVETTETTKTVNVTPGSITVRKGYGDGTSKEVNIIR